MEIPTFDKKNYSQMVFDYIFDQINIKKLKPGDKLPNERMLSEELGISRPPLREALKALSAIGLLTTRQGGRTYVNDHGPQYINTILKYLTVVDSDLSLDFVQLRKALESETARMAALHATVEEIANLEAIHVERKTLIESNQDDLEPVREEIRLLDLQFHNAIALASKNLIFSEFIDAIRNLLAIQQKFAVMENHMTRQSVHYHGVIVEAIKNHDSEAAAKAMYEHIQNVELAVEKHSGFQRK